MSGRDSSGTVPSGEAGPSGEDTSSDGPDRGRTSGDATAGTDLSDAAADASDPAERWMLRDDEFLLEEDREYVIRDEGRSWGDYLTPLAFGALLAVMVGDVITTGFGVAMGLEEVNPVATVVVAEVGLGGLVLVKTMAAVVLLLLPGVTGDARRTARAGGFAYFFVGLLVAAGNAWAVLAAT